jgi:cobalamin biosynthetic protein CobC
MSPVLDDTVPDAHGGDLAVADTLFGAPAAGWLDLSTGINPWPYPVPAIPTARWHRLPGGDDELRAAATRFYGAGDPDCIVAAAGSQAILQALPHVLRPGRVAVLGPTYAELSRVWAQAGHAVAAARTLDDAAGATILVLANPNNPDGRVLARDRLLNIAAGLGQRGGWLIVDEAFADATPEISLAPQAGAPGLIILRSFGKFFGLAGLRLGFALTERRVADRLRAMLGPWPVSGPALEIGAAALADQAWIDAMRLKLPAQARALRAALETARLPVIGGTALFQLAACDDAPAIFEALGARGIYVRRFAHNPRWLRFGLPGDAFARLQDALAALR